MKRYSLVIVSLLWISIFLVACTGSRALKKTPAGTPTAFSSTMIKIGTDATFPPFEIFDMKKKAPAGFDIELMKAIAARTGLDIIFFNVESNQLLEGVAQCQFDIGISAISITDELNQVMLFSDPYYTVGHVVVVKKGNLTITDRDQLSGMTVGAKAGSPGVIEISKISGAQIMTYDTFRLTFQELITGYIDAVIADVPHALSYVNIKANNLKIVGDEFSSVNYGIAICKQRLDLLKKINDGLAAIKADGALDKLAKKWNLYNGR